MKKILYWIIGLFVYWIILPRPPALAVGEFQADYTVDYRVSPDGRTIVTQNISLTNKLTNLYPTKYSILIDTEKIRDVVAYDQKGNIRPTITQKDGKTEIVLVFNEQVVGLGKTLSFALRFINEDTAQRNGAIWEVNIPGVVADPDIASYFVTLTTPASFGPNAYMSPLPSDGKRWNKQQMMAGGVSAAYGSLQAFSLNLSYFLQNPNVTPITREIALPPDTAFQKVLVRSVDPKPSKIYEDDDGNWLAEYSLSPGQKLDIQAALTIFITLVPQNTFGKTMVDSQVYTRPLKYWEANDPKIVELARTLRTPRAIYDYVVKTLSYDYGRVNSTPVRKGAIASLASPQNSICMEFTDLFVALARAAGIPAREVVGYAYTTNAKLRPLSLVADVLHAWPEYFDSERGVWVPVDPTWANTTRGVDYFTKLDFNHIAFAIHGLRSDTPYPAGFYKRSGTNSKDVVVSFADVTPELPPPAKLTATFTLPNVLPAGLTSKGALIIENPSGVAANNVDVVVSSSSLSFMLTRQGGRIPPYGTWTIPIAITIDNFFRFEKVNLASTVNGEVNNYYVDIQPAILFMLPFGIAILLTAVGFWYILARRSLWTILKR